MNRSLELISVLLTIAAFVWEAQKATQEQRIVLWVLIMSVFICLIGYVLLKYVAQKITQITENTQRIENLEKHFNIKEQLEIMNYKIATLEGATYGKVHK